MLIRIDVPHLKQSRCTKKDRLTEILDRVLPLYLSRIITESNNREINRNAVARSFGPAERQAKRVTRRSRCENGRRGRTKLPYRAKRYAIPFSASSGLTRRTRAPVRVRGIRRFRPRRVLIFFFFLIPSSYTASVSLLLRAPFLSSPSLPLYPFFSLLPLFSLSLFPDLPRSISLVRPSSPSSYGRLTHSRGKKY